MSSTLGIGNEEGFADCGNFVFKSMGVSQGILLQTIDDSLDVVSIRWKTKRNANVAIVGCFLDELFHASYFLEKWQISVDQFDQAF